MSPSWHRFTFLIIPLCWPRSLPKFPARLLVDNLLINFFSLATVWQRSTVLQENPQSGFVRKRNLSPALPFFIILHCAISLHIHLQCRRTSLRRLFLVTSTNKPRRLLQISPWLFHRLQGSWNVHYNPKLTILLWTQCSSLPSTIRAFHSKSCSK